LKPQKTNILLKRKIIENTMLPVAKGSKVPLKEIDFKIGC
jgi:hypothetical protein